MRMSKRSTERHHKAAVSGDRGNERLRISGKRRLRTRCPSSFKRARTTPSQYIPIGSEARRLMRKQRAMCWKSGVCRSFADIRRVLRVCEECHKTNAQHHAASGATMMTRACSGSRMDESSGRTTPFSTTPSTATGRRRILDRCDSTGSTVPFSAPTIGGSGVSAAIFSSRARRSAVR